jgi:hypothetical protein
MSNVAAPRPNEQSLYSRFQEDMVSNGFMQVCPDSQESGSTLHQEQLGTKQDLFLLKQVRRHSREDEATVIMPDYSIMTGH